MRHLLFVNTVAAGLLLASTAAFAGRAEADTCAARLPADAKLVYAASIDSVGPSVDLRDLVRSKTRSLVTAGQLGRGQVQAAAELLARACGRRSDAGALRLPVTAKGDCCGVRNR